MLINTFLVEDRADIRDTLIQGMEEIAPCRFVGHADSESMASQWLRAHPDDWQLAIVDLFLADGTGFGVLRDLQQRREGQKIVVLTSYSHENILGKCPDLGADEVFDKTDELEKLVAYCRAHAASLELKAEPPPPAAWMVDHFPGAPKFPAALRPKEALDKSLRVYGSRIGMGCKADVTAIAGYWQEIQRSRPPESG